MGFWTFSIVLTNAKEQNVSKTGFVSFLKVKGWETFCWVCYTELIPTTGQPMSVVQGQSCRVTGLAFSNEPSRVGATDTLPLEDTNRSNSRSTVFVIIPDDT